MSEGDPIGALELELAENARARARLILSGGEDDDAYQALERRAEELRHAIRAARPTRKEAGIELEFRLLR